MCVLVGVCRCVCVCVSVCLCACLPSQLPHLPDRLRLPGSCQPIGEGLRTAGPEVVAVATRRPVCMVADGGVMDYSNGMEGGKERGTDREGGEKERRKQGWQEEEKRRRDRMGGGGER